MTSKIQKTNWSLLRTATQLFTAIVLCKNCMLWFRVSWAEKEQCTKLQIHLLTTNNDNVFQVPEWFAEKDQVQREGPPLNTRWNGADDQMEAGGKCKISALLIILTGLHFRSNENATLWGAFFCDFKGGSLFCTFTTKISQ